MNKKEKMLNEVLEKLPGLHQARAEYALQESKIGTFKSNFDQADLAVRRDEANVRLARLNGDPLIIAPFEAALKESLQARAYWAQAYEVAKQKLAEARAAWLEQERFFQSKGLEVR